MEDFLRFDVIIVGGGLVGSLQAIALEKAGLSVAVVDHVNPQEEALMPDGRVYALAYGSYQFLKKLEIWGEIAEAAEPILDIKISDAKTPAVLHYTLHDIKERPSSLGFVIESHHLRSALLRKAAQAARWYAPETVADVNCQETEVEVQLASGRKLKAFLLIGADGSHSPLREEMEIPIIRLSYNQIALVGVVEHAFSHQGVAHEHFMAQGPFALLPMTKNRSSFIWTTTPAYGAFLRELSNQAFSQALNEAFGDHRSPLTVVGKRRGYPLKAFIATKIISRRFALIGDAAHLIHPVAGQGLNLGIRDVIDLTSLLQQGSQLGLDLGSKVLLEAYQKSRSFDHLSLTLATDGLVRLFSNNARILKIIRAAGLSAVGRLPPLKRIFMKHAMGVLRPPPRLLEGF